MYYKVQCGSSITYCPTREQAKEQMAKNLVRFGENSTVNEYDSIKEEYPENRFYNIGYKKHSK